MTVPTRRPAWRRHARHSRTPGRVTMRKGLGDQAAMRADKAVRPAGTPKIGSARRVIGKQLLKLRKRSGESQIVALTDVHGRHDGQTLALVDVCVNRIGKRSTRLEPISAPSSKTSIIEAGCI